MELDEPAAERTLRYFRRTLVGHPEDDNEFQHVCDFIIKHGQSLDWIFDGKIEGMICRTAAQPAAAMPVIAQASNDPILMLIDRHKVAFAEWIEAVNH